jgi:uncharacterized Zn finger protein
MACPNCLCEETYYVNIDDIDDHDFERCAACGTVFHSLESAPDSGEQDDENPNP